MLKRKRAEELEDPADLHIFVAGREEPLTANRIFLSFFSIVVKDLPPREGGGQATWDLRDVVLEGDNLPVDAATVQTWLDITCARLDYRPIQMPSCLEAGLRLLKFAEFAGTRTAVVRDIGSRMAQNQSAYLEVAVDGQPTPRLLLHGSLYYYSAAGHLCASLPDESFTIQQLAPAGPQFRSAVSSALEAALYLAARLDIPPLVLTLRNFALNQLIVDCDCDRILSPGVIYSPRVLQNLPREVLVEAFLERAFTDLSAGAKLRTDVDGSVNMEFTSPIAAAFFNKLPGERVKGLKLECSVDDQYASCHRAHVGMQVTTGGVSTKERRTLVQKLLANATAAEGTGPDAVA